MTDNHNYHTPAKGATDWHIPLNDNFESIDTDVEIRDIEANITDYVPKDGAKFAATDTQTVFFGDGTSWERAYRIGGDFDDLARGNIVYFGVTTGRQSVNPDTSDTPVRDAVEAIYENSEGGTVILPPTEIEHAAGSGNEIHMRPGISIYGSAGHDSGFGSSIKRTSGGDLITYNGDSGQAVPTRHTELAYLYLDGNASAIGNPPGSAIAFKGAGSTQPYQNWLHSLLIRKWSDSAIRGEEDFYATTFGPHINARLIDPNRAEGGRAIVDMTPTAGSNASSVGNYWMGVNEFYGHPNASSDSLALDLAGTWIIDSIQVGGSTHALLKHNGKSLVAKYLYWEPAQRTGSGDNSWLCQFDDTRRLEISNCEMTTSEATVDHGYRLAGFGSPQSPIGNIRLPEIAAFNGASIAGNVLEVDTDVDRTVIYEGDSADVRNDTGSVLTHPITCLGDVTKKVSTGTGYDGGSDDSQL